MNRHAKKIQDQLEKMPFIEARKAIRSGALHTIGSPNYEIALSWLEGKEAELRDARENETLALSEEANSEAKKANSIANSMSRAIVKDRAIAIIAVIIALIAARSDILWILSWVMDKINRP